MKRVFFVIGVLLSLSIFCACSSDDEMGGSSEGDAKSVEVLEPIVDGEDYAVISDFFKTAFGGSYDDEKPFDFKNNLSNDDNPCVVINNEEDFKEAYTGDLSLPAIDFSKYTLIIGKTFLSAGTFIDNVNIKTNSTKTTLFVNCIVDTKGWYIWVEYWEYYWKLYPKFHASKIDVEVSKEEGEVDDSKKR